MQQIVEQAQAIANTIDDCDRLTRSELNLQAFRRRDAVEIESTQGAGEHRLVTDCPSTIFFSPRRP